MRCKVCGEQQNPIIIAKKGYTFYAYDCDSHHRRKHSEIVRVLLDTYAYSRFETIKRNGNRCTWEQHVRDTIKEKGI